MTKLRSLSLRRATPLGCVALTFAFHACSVDERALAQPTPVQGVGGTSALAQAGAGQGNAGEEQGGAPASGEGLIDGCADLDTDGVADCTVTLVENPSFTSDASGWTAQMGSTLSWDAENALGDHPSGSAKLSADAARASASQCVPVGGGELIIAYASTLAEPDPDTQAASQAQLSVFFFDSADCSGASGRFFETPASTVTGSWVTVQAGGLALPSTNSASISLVGLAAPNATELSVYFDNVMLKAKAL